MTPGYGYRAVETKYLSHICVWRHTLAFSLQRSFSVKKRSGTLHVTKEDVEWYLHNCETYTDPPWKKPLGQCPNDMKVESGSAGDFDGCEEAHIEGFERSG